MASCVREAPRLGALNGIVHSSTHISLHTTLVSWISVEFSYHNLNSRRHGQFGRAGPRKPLWSQVQVPLATNKPLMTWPFVGWS